VGIKFYLYSIQDFGWVAIGHPPPKGLDKTIVSDENPQIIGSVGQTSLGRCRLLWIEMLEHAKLMETTVEKLGRTDFS
jgi:hypothetical protein